MKTWLTDKTGEDLMQLGTQMNGRSPAVQPEAQALVDKWVQTFNAGRVADLTHFYASDARIVPPGRPTLVGPEAARGFFAEIRAQGFRDYVVDLGDMFNKDLSLVASGRWALRGPGSSGVLQLYEGNWLNVFVPGPAGWLIAVHTWN
jgi:ketosteroid isomerase-like protein